MADKADKNAKPTAPAASPDSGMLAQMPVVIHAQYIKDLSFENPNPGLLHDPKGEKPVMDVNFSLEAVPAQSAQHKALYEVQLGVTVNASRAGQTAFLAQIVYGLLVSLENVPEEQHHPLLFIEVPRHGFPFLRQVVSQLTQQGGYMPLLLAPVDFTALYMQRFGKDLKKPQTVK